MKELKYIGKSRESADHKVKLRIATLIRDYSIEVQSILEKSGLGYIVDVYNNKNKLGNPNIIGVTLFYPSKQKASHMSVKEFGIDLGEKEFAKQVKQMVKDLKEKIP